MDKTKPWVKIAVKIVLTLAAAGISYFSLLGILIFSMMSELNSIIMGAAFFIVPVLLLLLIWFPKKKKLFIIWGIVSALIILAAVINAVWVQYDKSITVNPTPNINVHEYLPFEEDSKIVTLDREASLELSGRLPRIDGAAAVFPVYSAFVNATYPETTKLYDGYFEYNNTVGGYKLLGERQTDIFFGAYPSEEQIADAEAKGTEFVYTQSAMMLSFSLYIRITPSTTLLLNRSGRFMPVKSQTGAKWAAKTKKSPHISAMKEAEVRAC